jgi:putative cardiolipin synthase
VIRRLLPPISLCLVASCAYPRTLELPQSFAFDRPEETFLGQRFAPGADDDSGDSGLYILGRGADAFAARVALIDKTEQALDVQYYIFHNDVTGRWLMSRMLAAADRGVRVRLLLDDLGSAGIDDLIAAADVHPNLEIRLFNPFGRGSLTTLVRGFDFLVRPRRLNHRMHNKLLSGDGAAAIVGGRNVGDEYFDRNDDVNFGDLDLLAFGPVNAELGGCFDMYWNSPYVAPLTAWHWFERTQQDLDDLRVELLAHERENAASRYGERLRESNFVQEAVAGDLGLIWAPAHAVSDLPEKIVASRKEVKKTLLIERIRPYWPPAQRDLVIVSPYFVPRDKGVDHLVAKVAAGARVRVLTNSLAATDVSAVHAGYKGYRRDLLAGGVELYELRPSPKLLMEGFKKGLFGSSSASLHAKTFITDNQHVFVGSLNLDPRSVELNTELGLLIDSPELAAELGGNLDIAMSADVSWKLALTGGDIIWEGEVDDESVRLETEPNTSWWLRLKVTMLGWLPIQGQL